ncbi:hypothetical protein PTSG_03644 [Salpingoeca rosetta]|uniref:Elongation factor Ts, mitochondrial n=1 Tax=Salpingoeca rosetta (strain ATCC 50818 / BSB-021) TaxID=946362 RepID=F2U667_SALR5|nr:uncharacterized protein PTSG_03644 [Salpingoeca rosetta]EGD83008.1 hypothetical protein PTSG_03644 [Salpingoeca rosetta]|eukprot:XP_004995372.1 hypothetical protein PTSG_03644 [Salpingoeca rosetta]
MMQVCATRAAALSARSPALLLSRSLAVKPSVGNIKELRKRTDLPMKLCRQALAESSDDVNAAMEWLKNNEEARAQMVKDKLAGRAAAEGRVGVLTSPTAAALVKVNCETDFVARNDEFVSMVDEITESCMRMMQQRDTSTEFVTLTDEELASLPVASGTAKTLIDAALSTHGENLQLSQACGVHAPDTCVLGSYSHNNGSYAAVICLQADAPVSSLPQSAQDVLKTTADALAKNVVAVEPEAEEGQSVLDALRTQALVFSPDHTVRDELARAGKDASTTLDVVSFVRWQK